MERFAPHAFAILRIVAGLLFATHGSQKLLGYPPMQGGRGGSLPPLMIVGAGIELIGGLLIVIGLLTPIVAFICSGEMAVAYFMAHASRHWIPLVNRGELAVLYAFLWLFVAAHGAGIWSVDAALKRPRPATPSSGGAARP